MDATEYGELLVISNATFAQGTEYPNETSTSTLSTCGQAMTYPFYMNFNTYPVNSSSDSDIPNPSGLTFSLQDFTWAKIWTYRRSLGLQTSNFDEAEQTEVSNQNWGGGNDYNWGYIFLDLNETKSQAPITFTQYPFLSLPHFFESTLLYLLLTLSFTDDRVQMVSG
jgi:hypothetical protein